FTKESSMPIKLQKILLLIALATVILGGGTGQLVASSDDSSTVLSEQCDSTASGQSTLLVLERKNSTSDIDPTLLDPKNEKKTTSDIDPTLLDPKNQKSTKPDIPKPNGHCRKNPIPQDKFPQCPQGGFACDKVSEGKAGCSINPKATCRTVPF